MRRAVGVLLGALALCAPAQAAADDVRIDVLSNRADVISGGDALDPRDPSPPLTVTVGDRDVTGELGSDGVGLIDGLADGPERRDREARRRHAARRSRSRTTRSAAGVRGRAGPAVDLQGGRPTRSATGRRR